MVPQVTNLKNQGKLGYCYSFKQLVNFASSHFATVILVNQFHKLPSLLTFSDITMSQVSENHLSQETAGAGVPR